MSKASTPVDHALFEFIARTTIQEDDLLRSLREAAASEGLPETTRKTLYMRWVAEGADRGYKAGYAGAKYIALISTR